MTTAQVTNFLIPLGDDEELVLAGSDNGQDSEDEKPSKSKKARANDKKEKEMINDIFVDEEDDEDEDQDDEDEEDEIIPVKASKIIPKKEHVSKINKNNESEEENDFDNGNSQDPDFDVGGENALPDDNEIDMEADREKERYKEMEQRKADALARYGGQKLKRGNVDSSKIAVYIQGSNLQEDVENMLTEMQMAWDSDNSNNKRGKPGLAKLMIIDKCLQKLKHHEFANIFLDSNGLDLIDKFISMLPDGSWPLSSVRSKIFQAIIKLPIQVDHLRGCKIGQTLTQLQASKKEFADNKKMIAHIKDKWSRLICNITTEYSNLEQCEMNFMQLPLYTKNIEDQEENVLKSLILDFREKKRTY